MDTLIVAVGVVLIATGGLGLVVNIAARMVDLVDRFRAGGNLVSGLGDVVGKLSERSIAPAVVFLLGILLVDPVLFDYLWPGS